MLASFLLLPTLRCVQVKSSHYRGYCITGTKLPLRQHKQQSQGVDVRGVRALTQVSYGEIEIEVDAVFQLFFICCVTRIMTLHMKDLQCEAAAP